jgi:hypothetical protein
MSRIQDMAAPIARHHLHCMDNEGEESGKQRARSVGYVRYAIMPQMISAAHGVSAARY